MATGRVIPNIRREVVPVTDKPFEGDLFDRSGLAHRLTELVARLPDGGAFALDSQWGEGKTWFARHWRSSLDANGYSTVYIDAFGLDYLDDPFLMIAGEILAVAKERGGNHSELLAATARVGRALLPITAKLATGAAGKWLVGTDAFEDAKDIAEAAVEGTSEALEKRLQAELEEYAKEKQNVGAFRERLSSFTSGLANPLVVFVDELDRCRPSFAVRTIERMKHFFEVPGLVFVLVVNSEQLAAAIRGAYGPDLDAESYLRKFLLFSLSLPKETSGQRSANTMFCEQAMRAYGFSKTDGAQQFSRLFGSLSTALNLSLRDVERGVALFALAQPLNNMGILAAWVIALKFWLPPDMYQRLLRGDAKVHLEIIKSSTGKDLGGASILGPILDLHGYTAEFRGGREAKPDTVRLFGDSTVEMENLFAFVCSRVDLAIT